MRISIPRCGLLKYIVWFATLACTVTGVLCLLYLHITANVNRPPIELKPQDFQYGVMLDAGSSGTRVYLYKWPPGHTNGLLRIEQMKDKAGKILAMVTSPGLSAYADNPLSAYKSIKSLLLYASLNIPNGKHKETPLYILCTAGMRLLPEEKRNNIMNIVASNIRQQFDFFFKPSHIEVIDGRMEGVYGWIAVNYMLGRFDHDFVEHQRQPTVGALDMGGASTQITYEVPKSEELPSELSMDIDLGCHAHPGPKSHTYRLYATTFLGFGANEARKRYVDMLLDQNQVNPDHGLHYVSDPCLPRGMLETQSNHLFHHVTFKGEGNFTKCREKLNPLLNKPNSCPRSPCSMNGVFQPPINFYDQEMYGFSEYWYTLDDILHVGGVYKEEKFMRAAKEFCATDWQILSDRFKSGEFPAADQHRFQYQCFKSAWVLAILHDGHHFPSNYEKFISAKTVNSEVIQWTYGAMIYRTRYLPLREEGVDKVVSISVSKADALSYYAALLCFLVVLSAIIYWVYKLRKMRSTTFLPTTLADLHEFTHKPTNHYTEFSNPKINFNNVCLPPQNSARTLEPRGSGLLPRTFSDSLLNRDLGGGKPPIILGD